MLNTNTTITDNTYVRNIQLNNLLIVSLYSGHWPISDQESEATGYNPISLLFFFKIFIKSVMSNFFPKGMKFIEDDFIKYKPILR